MNLQQIRYFLELARELHFWKTSEKVFITQSALSRQIIALEQELGFKLFERSKRHVKLTPAGEFCRAEWEKLLIEIDDIHRHAAQIAAGEVGEIKIGYPGSITHSVLPELLDALLKKYPELQVDLFEISTGLEEALMNYKIDLGFRRDPLKNDSLSSKQILMEQYCVVAADHYPLPDEVLGDVSRLKDERFILPTVNSRHPYATHLWRIFGEYGFAPKVYIESEFGSTILGLVAKGLGLSMLPFSYSFHAPPGVRFIKIPHQTNLYVVWRKRDDNRVLDNFLKIIEESFGEVKE